MDIKWDNVERFTKVGMRSNIPIISITSPPLKNSIVINFRCAFVREASDFLKNKDYLIVYYSQEANAFVFDFVEDGSQKGSLKLRDNTFNRSASFTSVINQFNLDKEKILGEYYPVLQDIPNHKKSWVIYLNEKIS